MSADKWSKLGKKPAVEIPKEIKAFENVRSSLKVVIVDICNERGINGTVFGHDFGSWKQVTFKANLDEADVFGYECFCLHNVLFRGPSSSSTNFWLTPVSVGFAKVLEIHNAKILGVLRVLGLTRTNYAQTNFVPSFGVEKILEIITPEAEKYRATHTIEMLEASALEILDSNI